MADPLINVAVQATINGQLQFGPDCWTPTWWARTRLVLRQLQRQQEQQILQAQMTALACSWQAGDNRQAVQQVQDLLQRLTNQIRPTSRRPGDVLDLAARWYIVNVPERLRALGVKFGQLTTVREPTADSRGPAGPPTADA